MRRAMWLGMVAGVAMGQAAPAPTIRTGTTLVLVPTLVRTAVGQPVYGLGAKDFRVTDNGVSQQVQVEEVEGQPMSVVVLLQTGGAAQRQFASFARLGTVLDAMLGKAAGRVALVTFDSRPEELWSFPPRREGMEDAFAHPEPGDGGAAILDAVSYAMDVFDQEKMTGRRVILLISQPQDDGSKATAEAVVRRLGESNTTLYAATFSPERTWVEDQMRGDRHANKMYTFGPDYPKLDKTFNLDVPLRMALRAMRKDSPAEMAALSGGEHVRVDGKRDLEAKLMEMANELPNSYVLSFRPGAAVTPGLHTLQVEVPGRGVQVMARGSYWASAQ